jgi:hypothetical protein
LIRSSASTTPCFSWSSGGHPPRRYGTLTDIVSWCDWLDRSYPTVEELDGGLNRLPAAGLVSESRDRFYIPAKVWREYDKFRRRRRRYRFVMARQFVESAGPLATVPRRITIGGADLQKAIDENHPASRNSFMTASP